MMFMEEKSEAWSEWVKTGFWKRKRESVWESAGKRERRSGSWRYKLLLLPMKGNERRIGKGKERDMVREVRYGGEGRHY